MNMFDEFDGDADYHPSKAQKAGNMFDEFDGDAD